MDLDIDLNAVIADLSQKVAALTQENSILRVVVKTQQEALQAANKQENLSR